MQCSVTVCRDCCCGDVEKHPDVDHAAQLAALRAQARVRVSECVRACEKSNVVIVHPGPAARRAGARIVRLGEILDDTTLGAVLSWLDAGGPGLAPMPPILEPHVFTWADVQ